MQIILKIEQAVLFSLSVWFYTLTTDLAWWIYLALFLIPDISFVAYTINTKIGAVTYNLMHHQGVWILVAIAGFIAQLPWVLAIGIIFTGHSAFDRVFGYGLKYSDDFKNTHLGFLNNTTN